MKDELQRIVSAAPNPVAGRNVAREYLQARLLGSLQRSGAMIPLAFQGGTALRFLHGLKRYSEDLDFSLERPGGGYHLPAYLGRVRSDLEREAYTVEIKLSDRRPVHAALVGFPGLPAELKLSAHAAEKLAIKIEVDTRPPAGAGLETTVVRRHVVLQIQHHDGASLLAGKLHAVLARPFAKGRDLYDLVWYLGDPAWPAPNLTLLRNALAQTGWKGTKVGERTWRAAVRRRVKALDWTQIRADVAPFLETHGEATLLTEANLLRLLGPRR